MNFLGTLTATGASVNNHTTAVPFDVPDGCRKLWVESDTAGIAMLIGPGTGANYDTFTVASGQGTQLFDAKDASTQQGPFDIPRYGKSPADAAPAWVAGNVYAAKDQVTAHGWTWICVTPGTSNLYGTGPSYGSEYDGTVLWRPLGRAPDVGSTPNKGVVRIAILGTGNVKVWAE